MSTITVPRPRVNRKSTARPITVEMVLTINGQAYHVEPIANAPGGVKSYRLAKHSGEGATYDLDAFADRIVCACPSYTKTHEGTSSLCKHGRALIICGLVDYPAPAGEAPAGEAPAPAVDPADIRFGTKVRHRVADGTWKVVAAGAGSPTIRVRQLADNGSMIGPVQTWGRDVVGAIVADEPAPIPAETPEEPARADYDDAREAQADAEAPCCPADEPAPCEACVTPSPADGPATALPRDVALPGWDDDHVYNLGPAAEPIAPAEAEAFDHWIERQALAYAGIRSPRAAWIASKIAALAEQARFLDADGPDEFEDRLEAQADAARDAAEARARCC